MTEENDNEVTELVPVLAKPKTNKNRRDKQFWPTIEKKEYRQMYLFYEGLGKDRTLDKVAKEFSKSKTYVAVLSRAFSWLDRVKMGDRALADPVIDKTKADVDDVRLKLVTVVHEITDVLHAMAALSKKVRGNQLIDGKLGPMDTEEAQRLNAALSIYGVGMKDMKALKDLLATLKDVVRFNDDMKPEPTGPSRLTQINAPGAQLILRDD